MKRPLFTSVFLCSTFLFSFAQKKVNLYDTDDLSKEFHIGRRDAFREKLPDSTIAVFFAAPEKIRSNDVEYDFKQDPDFDYLTGLKESNSVLIIFKNVEDFDGISVNELLFSQDKNPIAERWTGRRLGADSAEVKLGFKIAKNSSDFADFKINYAKYKMVYYQDKFNDVEDDKDDRGDLASLLKHFKLKCLMCFEKSALSITYPLLKIPPRMTLNKVFEKCLATVF